MPRKRKNTYQTIEPNKKEKISQTTESNSSTQESNTASSITSTPTNKIFVESVDGVKFAVEGVTSETKASDLNRMVIATTGRWKLETPVENQWGIAGRITEFPIENDGYSKWLNLVYNQNNKTERLYFDNQNPLSHYGISNEDTIRLPYNLKKHISVEKIEQLERTARIGHQ